MKRSAEEKISGISLWLWVHEMDAPGAEQCVNLALEHWLTSNSTTSICCKDVGQKVSE